MAEQKTGIMLSIKETDAQSKVAFKAGQLIFEDSGTAYYDPTTGSSTGDRKALSPDLSNYLQKTIATDLITNIVLEADPSLSEDDNKQGIQLKITKYNLAAGTSTIDTLKMTTEDLSPLKTELMEEINKKQNKLTTGNGLKIASDKVDLVIDPSSAEILSTSETGLKIDIPATTDYTIAVNEETAGEYAKVYKITQTGTGVTATINIPKDMVVQSGEVKTYSNSDKPEDVEEEGTYIVLTLANANNDKIYIPAASLVEQVVGSQGTEITISVNTVGQKNTITASLVAGSIKDTHIAAKTITGGKLADGTISKTQLDSSIGESLSKADSATQSVEITEGTTNGTISVDIDSAGASDIKVHGLGGAAYLGAATSITTGEAGLTSGDLVAKYVTSALEISRVTEE